MKSRFQKGVVAAKAPKKSPKNFIYVNLPADQQAEMRAWARDLGSPLRNWINFAVRDARQGLIERVKLARRTGLNPTALCRLIVGNARN